MGRNLSLGALALFVAVCVASNLMPSSPNPLDPQNATQTPVGFEGREMDVRQVQADLVSALNNLDLNKGEPKRMSSGKIIVVPKFGLSRAEDKLIEHGPNVWLATPILPRDPRLVVFANSGRPLTAKDLRAQTRARGSTLDQVRKALVSQIAKLNRGEESGCQTDDFYIWAIPIKLTKPECIPCHRGMKVGDTVAISAYLRDRGSRSDGPHILLY